jgi:CubicO group peptidase (beta-lactamase class C family)
MALDIIAWHGLARNEHEKKVSSSAAAGYRSISLSLYGEPQAPLYAAVMIKRPVVIATEQHDAMSHAQWQETFNAMAAKGMGPYIVTATGPVNAAVYAAVFRAANPIPLTRDGLTAAEFQTLNLQAHKDGLKLVWMDSYGTPGDTRYIATWWPNPEWEAWNCDAADEDLATLQQRFDGITATWARAAHVAMTPAGRGLELFTDDRIGAYQSRAGMSASQYQKTFDQMRAAGLSPLRVSAKGSNGNARFAAIFAGREDGEARAWHTPVGPVTVPGIDAAMQAFMQAHGMRASALAIVKDTRLVYAKGYTLAEPDYPVAQPTTLFRQASCSKVFTAMAIWALMQQQRAQTPKGKTAPAFANLLDVTLQSVLALTTPKNTPPANPLFAKITLRDLLESRSGLDQGLVWQAQAAAQDFGTPLPAQREQLARHAAADPQFTGTPGDPKNVVYGNFDYFLLGQIVKTMHGSSTFEKAILELILEPLGMQRVRLSRSLIHDQLPDEALYHLVVPDGNGDGELTAGPSLKSPGQPLVATQYGAFDLELLGSCGGLSVAVTDMARLAASLSLRSGNPVLQPETIDAWLEQAATATGSLSGPDAHGYHGWDWVNAVDAKNHVYHGAKGGSLPGTGTEVIFTTTGLTYIVACGSSGRPGVKVDWAAPIAAVAEPHDWGPADLFPAFKMPSFAAAPPKHFSMPALQHRPVALQRLAHPVLRPPMPARVI